MIGSVTLHSIPAFGRTDRVIVIAGMGTHQWSFAFLTMLLWGCGRGPTYQPRRFADAKQAQDHFLRHDGDFRDLAVEWRMAGGREFFPHQDSWWWNNTYARKTWWGLSVWQIRRPIPGRLGETEEVYVGSLEEAGKSAGVSGGALSSLLDRTARLHVRSISEVNTPAGRPCTRFDLGDGWMGRPNGFLQCIGTTAELDLKEVHGRWLCPGWVQEAANDYRIIDRDWAYFEMSPGEVKEDP